MEDFVKVSEHSFEYFIWKTLRLHLSKLGYELGGEYVCISCTRLILLGGLLICGTLLVVCLVR